MWPVTRRDIHTNDDLYLTRYSCALAPRYFLHVFHRGDSDPDPHDHPWAFDTLPLTSYVEEVWRNGTLTQNLVLAGRWHQREASYCHRVIGPHWKPKVGRLMVNTYNATMRRDQMPWYTRLCLWWFGVDKIVTIVRHGDETRKWGFMQRVGAAWVWVPWKQYIDRAKNWMDH